MDETKAKAKKEGKLPVLALFDKGRPGFLIVVRSDDLAAVAAEAPTSARYPYIFEDDNEAL
jgi:hypothetical protein